VLIEAGSDAPWSRLPKLLSNRYHHQVAFFGRGSETVLDERTDLRTEEGDHERFSHYVPKDQLTEAMVMGNAVIALCGKVWTPSRDPERFPVCPECKDIWEGMKSEGDEGDSSGDA
jgi:hypothetical protein